MTGILSVTWPFAASICAATATGTIDRGQSNSLAFDAGDDDKVAAIKQACINQGLLVAPTRNGVVSLLPGLLITVEDVDEGMHRLDLALADLQKGWGPLCMQQRQVVNSR